MKISCYTPQRDCYLLLENFALIQVNGFVQCAKVPRNKPIQQQPSPTPYATTTTMAKASFAYFQLLFKVYVTSQPDLL